MSGIVYYRGKLTEVKPKGKETLQEIAKRILAEYKIKDKVYKDDYLECLTDNLYNDFVAVDGKLYNCERKELEDSDDIFNASKGEDGTINFEVKYHNGGRGFREALKEAFKRNKITP